MSSLWLIPVLAGLAAEPTAPGQWLNDYGEGLKVAKESGKPLLVVLFESNDEGPEWPCPQAETSAEEATLLNSYALCGVDVGTSYGQKVAEAFGVQSFPYTVIIDRTASVQIFKQSGSVDHAQWVRVLDKHKRGERRSAISLARLEGFSNGTICRT
jgi:hypothetical protein